MNHAVQHTEFAGPPIGERTPEPWAALADRIRRWGAELGFGAVGFADLDVSEAAQRYAAWIDAGMHGDMAYLARHAGLRAAPGQLQPGALRVISARMDYLPRGTPPDWRAREAARSAQDGGAVVSVYARGRDYHKVLRARLGELARRIAREVGREAYRPYCDSAPLLEVEYARKAGIGWRGKHTLLLTRDAGSMFFLGEILTDLPLPVDAPQSSHCGRCVRCIDACPTGAILGPYRLDARRCISYLTIEHPGAIPEDLRPAIGNRIYGCDDCQLVCPWNRHARASALPDFDVRNGLDSAGLAELFAWTPAQFRERLAGSPILRIGHERWLRNIAVGLGNIQTPVQAGPTTVAALWSRADHESALVREHVRWALRRHDVEV